MAAGRLPVAGMIEPAPPQARRRPAPSWLRPPLALAAAAAASVLATALAATVAGRQGDVALAPVELALRVALLLGAPCAAAMVAAMLVPRGGGVPTAAAVGLGVVAGPLLVLRLDRALGLGVATGVLVVLLLALWGLAGATLAAGWWARPSRQPDRTVLPDPSASSLPAGLHGGPPRLVGRGSGEGERGAERPSAGGGPGAEGHDLDEGERGAGNQGAGGDRGAQGYGPGEARPRDGTG